MELDNRTLIQALCKIRNKRGKQVSLVFNAAQNYYWRHRTRRNIILKARQKGISKLLDADLLFDCIRKPTNAVVISHESGATKRMFAAVKYYLDNLAIKPVISIDNGSEIKFPKAGSHYFIGTAGQKAFGRGDTIDRAHLSEFAFYERPERVLAGISEACEYGQIDIESTPNGRNYFYDLWQNAKIGLSPYSCIFIPWFIDKEYSIDNLTETERNGLSAGVRAMFDIPDEDFQLTDEEKNLKERVQSEYNIELTIGQIKWRRYKIWDRGTLFKQEYPEDDVSCFLVSGRSVFSEITLEPYKKINLEDFENLETESHELLKRMLYCGVDCAEGSLQGDRHVFSVIDASTPKATVIYEYASTEPIDIFWQKIAKIIRRFKMTVGVEKNGVGVAHINQAKLLRLPIVEWQTTGANKPVMITDLEEAYRKQWLIETYPEAVDEAHNMIYTKNNSPEAPHGKHDDRIMSRAIAWQMRKRPRPMVSVI